MTETFGHKIKEKWKWKMEKGKRKKERRKQILYQEIDILNV